MYRYYKFNVPFLQLITQHWDSNALFLQFRSGFTIEVVLCLVLVLFFGKSHFRVTFLIVKHIPR